MLERKICRKSAPTDFRPATHDCSDANPGPTNNCKPTKGKTKPQANFSVTFTLEAKPFTPLQRAAWNQFWQGIIQDTLKKEEPTVSSGGQAGGENDECSIDNSPL